MLAKFPSNKRDKMKIAIVGATGNVGKRIVDESLHRGHTVTGIARDPFKLSPQNGLTLVKGDANDPSKLGQLLVGHDVVISSIMFLHSEIASLVEAVRASGVKRYLVVGGAGSLEVAPGKLLVDQPDFPDFVKAEATKGGEYLNYLKKIEDLDWTSSAHLHCSQMEIARACFAWGKMSCLLGWTVQAGFPTKIIQLHSLMRSKILSIFNNGLLLVISTKVTQQ
jgi:NAD(P)-dependent dehydrogenase (short-subunit alcohol dehydrogenase family)